MTNTQLPSPLREQDFEAIEAAVMETERGRWFLAEYARRHRAADTVVVMDAIGRLEKLLRRERRPDADRIRLDIGEMKDAIERTKAEIAEIKFDGPDGSRFHQASDELDAIVSQTEQATSEILESAEKIQEIAWVMREAKVEEEICAALETLTTTIYTSCSFQDLTGQRTQKVVHVLRYLESRIDSMIEIWGMEPAETAAPPPARGANPMDQRPDAHLLNGPALAGQGTEQSEVDELMAAAEAEARTGISAADTMEFDRIEAEEIGDEAALGGEDAEFEVVEAADDEAAVATLDVEADDAVFAEGAAAEADAAALVGTTDPADLDAFAADAELDADEAAFAEERAADVAGDEEETDGLDADWRADTTPAAIVAAPDDEAEDVLDRLTLDERFALFA